MKKLLIGTLLIIFISIIYLYKAYSFKEKAVLTLKSDLTKLTIYDQWGYDAKIFKDMYLVLLQEVKATSYVQVPFRMNSFNLKHDNILRLTQAGYATEVSKQKSEVQTRLSYLRDRVKNNAYIQESRKLYYFDSFEVVAGNIFEKNSDLNDLRKFIVVLEDKDSEITKEIESVRKESIFNEIQAYRLSCIELLNYFIEKNSPLNQELAQKCIDEADKLTGTRYANNGADFIETLSRERVFTASQKASQAKQQLIQDEQYALLAKQREIERLTVVPPALRQEGKIIVVNIGLQRLYAYENGATLFSTAVPITTGKQGFETVLGEFAIYLKEEQHQMQSPFPGIYYDDVVNYWMPFYLGYGLHDAPWRSVYGTQDYSWVGSHGCVNIPLKEASILYNWAQVGTRVFVL